MKQPIYLTLVDNNLVPIFGESFFIETTNKLASIYFGIKKKIKIKKK